MTKTIALTIGQAEIAMEAIAKYTELMESQEETKWLSEGADSIVTSIIDQLGQTGKEAQSCVKLEAAISSHLSPSELENYSLTDVSITLINNNTGEKSVVEVDDFDLTEFQWIDQEKQWEEEEKEMELNKIVLPLRHDDKKVEQSPKWILDLEQREGGEVELTQNMANDIAQALSGIYFTYDEFGYEVPSTNQIEAYETVMEAAQGYLIESARRIEFNQDLEEKLMSTLEASQTLTKKQNKLLEEVADFRESMNKLKKFKVVKLPTKGKDLGKLF